MLEFYLTYWLHAVSKDDAQKLCRSMTGRPTSLVHSGMTISFFDERIMALRDFVKIISYFEYLKVCAFNNLMPVQLGNYEPLKVNLDLRIERACYTLMRNLLLAE